MVSSTTVPEVDLAAVLEPIAAALLPGWTVTCEALPREEMDKRVPNALAICSSIPTRSMAHVRVVTPFPESEDLVETLWHELTHAALSPITHQLGESSSSVMVEEQIVERLSVLLAKVPLAARLAVARAINTFAPAQLRARLSTASAGRRARTGAAMDPELLKAAVDALEANDAAKALEILKGLIISAASGGAAAPAAEPDGDEPPAPKVDAGAEDGAAPAGDASGAPEEGARVVARKGKTVETADQKRARIAREQLEADAAESKVMIEEQRKQAKQGLIENLRARLPGHSGLPGIEKKILAAPTFERAKEISETAIEMGGGHDRARKVASDGHKPAEDTTAGAAPFTVETLVAEGLPPKLAAEAVEQWKIPGVGKKLAEQTITMARARLHGHASSYMPTKPANGAQKAS